MSTTAPGGMLGSNAATTSTTVARIADLSVTKIDSVDPAVPGGQVQYTVVVTNSGPSDAANVTFTDAFSSFQTFDSFSGGTTWGTGATGPNGPIVGSSTTLPVGGTLVLVYTLNTLVSAPAGAAMTNTFTVSSADDTNTANNSATETTTVQVVDLEIVKTAAATVEAGTTLTYTLSVTNLGGASATDVVVTEPLPAGVTFLSAVAPAGFTISTPAVGANGTVTMTAPNLAAGATANLTVVVQVPSSTANGTVITDTATVNSNEQDASPADNSSTVSTTVAAWADLVISQTDSPDPVLPGQNVTYTIVVSNNGPSDAQSVALTNAIPANTTFVSLTGPGGWSLTTPAVGGTGTFTAARPTLAAGTGPQVFTLTVNVNPNLPAQTTISNTATIASSTSDPVASNNSASENTTAFLPAPGASAVVGGTLVINGTQYSDAIIVRQTATTPTSTVTVYNSPFGVTSSYPLASFSQILIYGRDGNDAIVIESPISKPATVYGEAGNDSIVGGLGNDYLDGGDGADSVSGGAGADIVLGGAGNDSLSGDAGLDLILGGQGADTLIGGLDDDLEIGGSLTNSRAANYRSILATWTSGQPFATRVASLGGSINALTVADDGVADYAYGSGGRDWLVDFALRDYFFDFDGNSFTGDRKN